METTIETWKVDLSRLVHEYIDQRPDGKTGKVTSFKDIINYVDGMLKESTMTMVNTQKPFYDEGYKKGVKDLAHRIDCNTLISELYGWKTIVEASMEEVLKNLD